MSEWQPIVRILLRYLAGVLISSGVVSGAAGDALLSPELLTALAGVIVGVGTELWYKYAKRNHKPT